MQTNKIGFWLPSFAVIGVGGKRRDLPSATIGVFCRGGVAPSAGKKRRGCILNEWRKVCLHKEKKGREKMGCCGEFSAQKKDTPEGILCPAQPEGVEIPLC